jgi:hypothetical protein
MENSEEVTPHASAIAKRSVPKAGLLARKTAAANVPRKSNAKEQSV